MNARDEAHAELPATTAERIQLEHARAAFGGSVKRRLLLWAVRWAVGFAAIGGAVYVRPALAWLFRAGAGVAAASLVVMLITHRLTLRRLATAERRLDDVEELAREAEWRSHEQKVDWRE